jgi:hypothetical protein
MSTISTAVRSTFFPHLPSPAAHPAYQPLPGHQTGFGFQQQHEHSFLANEATYCRGGLQTPPAESNMSTAYHPHNSALASTYNSHVAMARQPASLIQTSRAGAGLCDVAVGHIARSQPQQHSQLLQQQQQQQHCASNLASVTSISYNDSSRHSTRPSTPSSTATSVRSHFDGSLSRRDSTMVTHSLQLPSCISSKGGNLDEFASLVSGPGTRYSRLHISTSRGR